MYFYLYYTVGYNFFWHIVYIQMVNYKMYMVLQFVHTVHCTGRTFEVKYLSKYEDLVGEKVDNGCKYICTVHYALCTMHCAKCLSV